MNSNYETLDKLLYREQERYIGSPTSELNGAYIQGLQSARMLLIRASWNESHPDNPQDMERPLMGKTLRNLLKLVRTDE